MPLSATSFLLVQVAVNSDNNDEVHLHTICGKEVGRWYKQSALPMYMSEHPTRSSMQHAALLAHEATLRRDEAT